MKLHLPSGLRKALLACIATFALPVTTFASASSALSAAALVSFVLTQHASAASDSFDAPHDWDEAHIHSNSSGAFGTNTDFNIDDLLSQAETDTSALVIQGIAGYQYTFSGGSESIDLKLIKTLAGGKATLKAASGSLVAHNVFLTGNSTNTEQRNNLYQVLEADTDILSGIAGTIYIQHTGLLIEATQNMSAGFSIGSAVRTGSADSTSVLQIAANVTTTGSLEVQQDTGIDIVGATFTVAELTGDGNLTLGVTAAGHGNTISAGTLALTEGGADYGGVLTFAGTSAALFTIQLGEDSTLQATGLKGSYGAFTTASGVATLRLSQEGAASNMSFSGVTLELTLNASQSFTDSQLDGVTLGNGGTLTLKGTSSIQQLQTSNLNGNLVIGEGANITIGAVASRSTLASLVLGNESTLDISGIQNLTISSFSIESGESATIRLSLAAGGNLNLQAGTHALNGTLYIELTDETLLDSLFEGNGYELFANTYDPNWDVRIFNNKFGRLTLTLNENGCIVANGYNVDVVWDGGEDGVWSTGGSGWDDGAAPENAFLEGDDVIFREGMNGGKAVSIHSDGVTAGSVTIGSGSWSFSGEGDLTATSFTVQSGSVEFASTGSKALGSINVAQGAEFIISNATGWGADQANLVTGDGSLVFKGLTLDGDSTDALIKATLKNATERSLAALRLRNTDLLFGPNSDTNGTDLRNWMRAVSDIYVENGSSIGANSATLNISSGNKPTLHLSGAGVQGKGALYVGGASNRTVSYNIVIEQGGATINTNSYQLDLNGSITNNGQTITIKSGTNMLWLHGSFAGTGGTLDVQEGTLLLEVDTTTYEVKLGDNTALKTKGNYTMRNLYGDATASLASYDATAHVMTISNADTVANADKVYSGTIAATVSVDVTGGYWSFNGTANGALSVGGGNLVLTGGSINGGLTTTGGSVKLAGNISLSAATVNLSGTALTVDSGASLSIAVAGYTSTTPVLTLTAAQVSTLSGLSSITLTGESLTFDTGWTLNLLSISDDGTVSQEVLDALLALITNELDDDYEFRLSGDGVLSVVSTAQPPVPNDFVWNGGEAGTWSEGGTGWVGSEELAFTSGSDVIFRDGGDNNVNIAAAGVSAGNVTVESGSGWVFSGEGDLTATSFTVRSGSVEFASTGSKALGSISVEDGAEFIISNATGWGGDQSNLVTGDGSLVFKRLTLNGDSTDALIKATLKNATERSLAALRLRNTDLLFGPDSSTNGTDLRNWMRAVSDIYVENGSSIGANSASMNIGSGNKPTLHLSGNGVGNKGALYIGGAADRTVSYNIVIEQGGTTINANDHRLELNGTITNNGETITKINGGNLWLHGSFAGSGGMLDIQGGALLLEADLATYEVKLSDNTSLKSKGNYTVSNLYGSSAASLESNDTSARVMTISNADTSANADKVYSGTIAATASVDVTGGYWSFGGTANGALSVSGGNLVLTGGSINKGLTATSGSVKLAGAVNISAATVNLSGAALAVDSSASLSIAVAGYTADSAVMSLTADQLSTLSGISAITLTNTATWTNGYSLNLFDLGGGTIGGELLENLKSIINLDLLNTRLYTWELSETGVLSITNAAVVEPGVALVWSGGVDGTWSNGGSGWVGDDDPVFISGGDVIFRDGVEGSHSVTVAEAGVNAGSVMVESGTDWEFSGGQLVIFGDLAVGSESQAAVTFSNAVVLSGDVNVNTDSSVTFSGATTFNKEGGTTISGGEVILNGTTTAMYNLGDVTVDAGATLRITSSGSGTNLFVDGSKLSGGGCVILEAVTNSAAQLINYANYPFQYISKLLYNEAGHTLHELHLAKSGSGTAIFNLGNAAASYKAAFANIEHFYVDDGVCLRLDQTGMFADTGANTLHLAGSGAGTEGANGGALNFYTNSDTINWDVQLESDSVTIRTEQKGALAGMLKTQGHTLVKTGGNDLTISGSVTGGGKLDIQAGKVALNNAASDGENVSFAEVTVGAGANLSVGADRSGGVWVGTVTSTETTAVIASTAGATTLKLKNELTEATATQFLGTTGANAAVELTSGAWKFGGTANGALSVSGGNLILTGGSINKGLTATGGSVKLAGAVSISAATVNLSGAVLAVDSGASLSIAVAGYQDTTAALSVTAQQVGALSRLSAITLTGDDLTFDEDWTLQLLNIEGAAAQQSDLDALAALITNELAEDDLAFALSEDGVLSIVSTYTPPEEPKDDRWVWQGDTASGSGDMVWSSDADNWNQDNGTTPDGKDVYFEGEGDGSVSIQGTVSPRSIWVKSGSYEFSAADESAGGLSIGSPVAGDGELGSGVLAVGAGDAAQKAELKLSLKNTKIDQVNLLAGGTLILNHQEALTQKTFVVFSGGELAYENSAPDISSKVSATDDNLVRVRVGAAVASRSAEGLSIAWGGKEQSRSNNSGIALVLAKGVEKTGSGTFTVEWSEEADARLDGSISASEGSLQYVLHAAGHTVSFEGDPVQTGGVNSAVAFSFAAGDEGTMVFEKAFAGKGAVQIGSAADSGAYQLATNNSGFGGSIRLEGSGVASAGAATALVAGALGGTQTTLVLAGRSLRFEDGVAPVVNVREIVAEAGSVTYVGGAERDAANEAISLAAPISGSGTLANATGGFTHTITGDLSGFSGAIVAGAAGTGNGGSEASVWTLRGMGSTELQANFSGTGSIVIDYDGEVRLTGRIGSDDAANNQVSLETPELYRRVVIADVDESGLGKNSSTGALVGEFYLGDAKGAGTWAGQTVDGYFELANGWLLNPITTVTEGSQLNVETAKLKGGVMVHAGGTDASLFEDIVIHAGGHLTGVSGTLSIGAADGLTFAWLYFGADNVGSSSGSSSTDYLMDITGGAKLVEPEGIILDFSAEGFVQVLQNVLKKGDAWLHTVYGGLTIDPNDYMSLLGTRDAGTFDGDTLPQLLRSLGFEVKSVNGGDIILTGSVRDVYFVLEDGQNTHAHEVTGYNVLSAYKATVVDEGETLTLNLKGAPDAGTIDGIAGGAMVNNLVGLEGSTFQVRKSGSTRVALVLSNETQDVAETGGFDEVRAQNTTFKGTIKGNAGVDLVKTGAGTLTIGDEDTGLGGLQLEDGDIRLKAGALRLVGEQNHAKSLSFDWEDAAASADKGLILQGEKTALSLESIHETSAGLIYLQQGAELKLTGSSYLEGTAITAGDDALGGTLTVASGASVELASVSQPQLEGVAVQIEKDAALHLGSAKGNNLTMLNGRGDLVGRHGAELSITGKGSSFSGSFSGAGDLIISKGASMELVAASSGAVDTHGCSWSLQNRGALLIDISSAKDELWFDELTLGSGSVTTLVLDTNRNNAGLLGGDTLIFEEGAKLIITAGGDEPLTGRRLVLAGFDGSEEELRRAEGNITLQGGSFLRYTAGGLHFEGGQLVLDLLERTENPFITPNMAKNARAGAALAWELTDPASAGWRHIQNNGDGHLAAVMNTIETAYDNGAMDSVADTLAAVAGASTSVLSSAMAQDIRRQLSGMRNRSAMTEPSFKRSGVSSLHLWLTGETSYHKLDADGMAPGFTLNGWGGSIGADVDVTASTTCGLALSAMYNDLKTDSADNGKGDMDMTYLSAYARTIRGAWTHSFVASVGVADVSFDRTVNYGALGSYTAHGSTDGVAAGFMYELGYSFILNRSASMLLQPVFNVQYSHTSLSSYTETGTDAALHVDDMEQNQWTLGLGARFQSVMGENAFNRLAFFEARALVKAELGDRSGTAATSLISAESKPVEVEGAKLGTVGIEVGAGVSVPLGRRGGTLFMDASAEFRSGYTNANASVGYRVNF